ncbi:MAG: glycosyltransferase family 2 protein [Oscillospiraceae bacterium]|nr:glycosyltransferase family 2 protein [Oscillospiraceae bacterium]
MENTEFLRGQDAVNVIPSDGKTLTVILPAYNEEKMIRTAAETISGLLDDAKIPFELLFVDDGSRDSTWREIQSAARQDPRVRGLHFSRNFGKEAAMFAGLEKAAGACCVVIDCDLQHPPEKIIEMYRLWQEGFEVVEGIKSDRGEETAFHRFASKRFYDLISLATGMDMASSSDFKLLDRKVVDALNAMPERNVFFRALSFWVGFRKTEVHYEVRERTAGVSKWSTKSLIRYAITNIGSFSSAPLHIVTILGLVMLVVMVVFGIISLVQKITGVALGGFTTVILLLLFIGSILMISLGIIGYYIARIYDEIKGRPRYIIAADTAKNTTGGQHSHD